MVITHSRKIISILRGLCPPTPVQDITELLSCTADSTPLGTGQKGQARGLGGIAPSARGKKARHGGWGAEPPGRAPSARGKKARHGGWGAEPPRHGAKKSVLIIIYTNFSFRQRIYKYNAIFAIFCSSSTKSVSKR